MPRRNSQVPARADSESQTASENEDAPMTTQQANQSLMLLADAAAEREANLDEYDVEPRQNSDVETDSLCPYLDRFYETGGSAAILNMTNFSVEEFDTMWDLFGRFIDGNYNVVRGRKCDITPKDAFFMMPAVLKNGGQWDWLARVFGRKGPSFESFMNKFVHSISEFIFESAVTAVGAQFPMENLISNGQLFKNYLYARNATDVTFQQAYRPSGNVQEGKKYYSGTHKLYGYEVEVSVLPNGLALGCSQHYPGSISDLIIFQENSQFHSVELKKTRDERQELDGGELGAEYPRGWGVLMDKGYQGASEICQARIPNKKQQNGNLPRVDEQRNLMISRDRIIVENFFGRVGGLWNVAGGKWKWCEKNYDSYFRLCVALTNVHIRWHPLRTEDCDRFRRMRNRIFDIGSSQLQKRKRIQERYRQRRKARMDIQFRAISAHGRQTEDDC